MKVQFNGSWLGYRQGQRADIDIGTALWLIDKGRCFEVQEAPTEIIQKDNAEEPSADAEPIADLTPQTDEED